MSRTIDERIVEMRFDNKEFEKNVKTTMTTLDRLKEALNMSDSAKSFNALEKAAENVSLEGIAAGVESLQKRFSTFGIVSMRIIENVTDSLIGLAKKGISFVENAIVSGGMRRAQNIENAHFQLQALLKDEEKVQAIMDDAMASVSDTAYAYDEAAKAASQFAASGLEAGENMQSALRGIVGVSAMTNSEYESISRIFTTVAGNGRLMGDQLLQLSSRGLNAASTLANYFKEVRGQANMTEAEIREMVSKGQIDFQTFAAAMDWAFGESAFRANETFTGVLSNIRAAFAKIGADFFSPLIEQNSNLILMLNTFKDRVNALKKEIIFDEKSSAISGLTKVTGLQIKTLDTMFTAIEKRGYVTSVQLSLLSKNGLDATKTLTDYINGVNNGTITASYATRTALSELTEGLEVSGDQVQQFVEDGKISLKTFTSAMETAYGDQRSLSKEFSDTVLNLSKRLSDFLAGLDFTKPMEAFYHIVDSVKNVFNGLYSILKPIGEAFASVFLNFKADSIVNLAKKIEILTSKMKISEKNSKNLHDIFKGLFDIVKLLGDGFIALLKAIFPIGGSINSLGDELLNLAGGLGRSLSSFSEWIRNSTGISKAYNIISESIEKLSTRVSDFITNMKKFPIVQKAVDGLKNAFNSMGEILSKIEIRFNPFTDIFDLFLSIIKSVGPIAIKVLNGIGTAISTALSAISSALKSGGFNSFFDLINSGIIVGLGVGISKFIENISATVSKAGGIFSNINRTLITVKNTLLSYQAQLKANVLKTIAVSIAILAGSLLVLSLIDSKKLESSLGAVTVLMGELFAMMTALTKMLSNSKLKAFSIGKLMTDFSVSILILAGALKVVSGIDQGKLWGSVGAITALMAEMAAISILLSKYGGKVKTGVSGIIAFSAAIYILASSVKKLGELDPDVLLKGLLAVLGLMAELAMFMTAAQFGKFKTSQALAIVALSVALRILQKSVEGFGNIDTEVLIKGILSIAGVLSAIGIFSLLGGQSKHILSTSIALIAISYALSLLVGPVKDFGSMDIPSIAKGIITMSLALAAITTSMRLMPKNILTIGLSLLIVSKALTSIGNSITGLGSMEWTNIVRGLVALGSAMAILVLSLNLMKGTMGASASMLVMSSALAIFSPVLKDLGNMSWSQIGKGLATLAIGFGLIGAAGLLLQPVIPAILGLSGAMMLLGIACAAVGGGILAFSVGLTTLAASGVATASALVEILKILVVGVLKTITESAEALRDAVKTIVLSCIEVILDCATPIAKTVLQVLKEVLTELANNGPEIVSQLLKFLIGIIDALALDMPIFVESVLNLFSEFFSSLGKALMGMDITPLIDGIIGLAVLSGLMIELAAMSTLAPAAMAGVISMGLVVVELTALLAAIGLIEQIPGLNWLVSEGGNLLKNVGSAIGKFIGGFVGGTMDGVTSQLPAIGSNLSDFMRSIQPFIEGASKIDKNAMSGITSLAKTILLLTASDILDGLTSWLTGGNNLTKFGEEIAEFGPFLSKFAESTHGISGDSVQSAANAAKILSEMASGLPNSGGLAGKIFGNNSLADFAQELVIFGPKLARFANSVKYVDSEAVQGAASAAKIMSEMASGLPNSGGFAAKVFGDNRLSDFGRELSEFAPYLVRYATSISGVNPDVVIASASAANALSELANNLPNSGGLVSLFTGDNGIGSFGSELEIFGVSFKRYYDQISNIDSEKLNSVISSIKSMIKITEDAKTINENDLSSIIESFKSIGKLSLESFSNEFTNGGDQIISAMDYITNQALSVLESKIIEFNSKGRSTSTEYVNGFMSNSEELFNNAQSIIENILNSLDTKTSEFQEKGTDSGQRYLDGFRKLYSETYSVTKALANNALSPLQTMYSSFYNAGANAGQGYVDGLRSKIGSARSAGISLAQAAYEGVNSISTYASISDKMVAIADVSGSSFVGELVTYVAKAGEAGKELGESALEGTNSAITKVINSLDKDIELNPVIKPVMEIDEFQKSATRINEWFDQSMAVTLGQIDAASASMNLRRTRDLSEKGTSSNNSSENTFIFNQYNTSPKALSRIDIYRDTKSQFARFKEKVNSAS